MGFCVPLQRHEKRRHWVWLLNIHLHFPLYGHNMLGLINFSQRWSSAHHLLGDNHICMPLRIIPLLLKLQSYSSQTPNFQTLLPGTETKVVYLYWYSVGQGQAPQSVELGDWKSLERFCLVVVVFSTTIHLLSQELFQAYPPSSSSQIKNSACFI